MTGLSIRGATPSDREALRGAIVELQEHERRLHATRLSGETIADAYLAWMLEQAAQRGAALVAEVDGDFAGFAAGWIVEESNIAETPDSNRFGLISDVCILPRYRGRRIASRLLEALEADLGGRGVSRIRLGALAGNMAARASYERSGFAPYEVIYEKVVGADGA
jgi:ribosomal protein S18 acetylase RimI-like enzyme